jgi:hypothetical protein
MVLSLSLAVSIKRSGNYGGKEGNLEISVRSGIYIKNKYYRQGRQSGEFVMML